jgi:hypothetical protein
MNAMSALLPIPFIGEPASLSLLNGRHMHVISMFLFAPEERKE